MGHLPATVYRAPDQVVGTLRLSHWHGDAIGQVLQAHGETAGRSRLADMRRRLPRRGALRPALSGPALFTIASAVTRHLTTLQMAWGSVNERTAQARRGLADSAARCLTRAALRRPWGPVGSGVMPRDEIRFLVGHQFADSRGRATAERIDRAIDRLPGLSGLHLIESSVDELAA
ncbi:MAG TPA: hypothetical protein VMF60_06605 [Acidimicrobiales bacterium]|nr:hypothetical protein [Acidimicrobiales bacterium]